MFQLQPYPWQPLLPQIIMYIGVMITSIYMLYKYRKDSLSILLILMFFQAPFIFFGSTLHNLYKIILFIYTGYCLLRRNAFKIKNTQDWLYLFSYVLFSIAFFSSILYSRSDGLAIIFSQYARFVEIFCLFFLLKDAIFQRNKGNIYIELFYKLFFIQILVTIAKLFLFSFNLIEGLVGTFTISGGAVGTTIPILAFLVLFLYRQGKLSKWDWLYVIGLLAIGFATGKRAIWFIFPFVVVACLIYIKTIQLNKYLILALFAVPIVYYFGARLIPSLNPENEVWGSFDLEYMLGYAEQYQFGDRGLAGFQESQQNIGVIRGNIKLQQEITAQGRGNATIELIRLIFSGDMVEQDWHGLGLSSFYSTNYEEFQELPLTIKLAYKGAGTGAFQAYVTIGVLGFFTMVLFCFLPMFFIKQRRLRLLIIGILLWEYFMYAGSIFRDQALMATLFLIIFYSNYNWYIVKVSKQDETVRQQKEREHTRSVRMNCI